jgi:hypothetical protein
LKLSDPLTANPNYFPFLVSSYIQGIDKLEKMNLMIAANNTWQGIVGDNWPYGQGKKISKKKSRPRYHKTYYVIHTIFKLHHIPKLIARMPKTVVMIIFEIF